MCALSCQLTNKVYGAHSQPTVLIARLQQAFWTDTRSDIGVCRSAVGKLADMTAGLPTAQKTERRPHR